MFPSVVPDVPANALRMLFLPDYLSVWLCLLNDKVGSRYTPNILGDESLMSILGWALVWCVSGVSNVTEDFGVEISK